MCIIYSYMANDKPVIVCNKLSIACLVPHPCAGIYIYICIYIVYDTSDSLVRSVGTIGTDVGTMVADEK